MKETVSFSAYFHLDGKTEVNGIHADSLDELHAKLSRATITIEKCVSKFDYHSELITEMPLPKLERVPA